MHQTTRALRVFVVNYINFRSGSRLIILLLNDIVSIFNRMPTAFPSGTKELLATRGSRSLILVTYSECKTPDPDRCPMQLSFRRKVVESTSATVSSRV